MGLGDGRRETTSRGDRLHQAPSLHPEADIGPLEHPRRRAPHGCRHRSRPESAASWSERVGTVGRDGARRGSSNAAGGLARAAVLGANDGIVSTASLVIGVAASDATRSAVLVAGLAGLAAGAMSMAAGEYVSVSSQADTERADVARERGELAAAPARELDELDEIYAARGLDDGLAREVAVQLMRHDALGAHSRNELGISETMTARPVQAALTSAATFAVGAAPPLVAGVTASETALIVVVALDSAGCACRARSDGRSSRWRARFPWRRPSGLLGRHGDGHHGADWDGGRGGRLIEVVCGQHVIGSRPSRTTSFRRRTDPRHHGRRSGPVLKACAEVTVRAWTIMPGLTARRVSTVRPVPACVVVRSTLWRAPDHVRRQRDPCPNRARDHRVASRSASYRRRRASATTR